MKKIILGMIAALLVGIIVMAPKYTYKAEAFTKEEAAWLAEAKEALEDILDTKDIMALVYLTDEYVVRSEASADSGEVARVGSGQLVLVKGMEMTEEYEPWIRVEFLLQDRTYNGYIERSYLACSDELFLQWEMDYGVNFASYTMQYLDAEPSAVSVYADIEQFPESYKAALTALKQTHPNWIFVKQDTGLNWDTVVSEELYGGRSLVPASLAGSLQEGKYSSGWFYATEEALEYYLDPRNGLTEEYIFQFEQLTYNASYHESCETALQSFLNNTFMSGNVPQASFSYAHGFWAIGKEMNISPFHLASRVYQEQGKGTSPLISGTYPGYEGYYNYFNIGASGATDKEVIESGLTYAKNATPPWNTPYYSLHYGAKIIGSNYITKGQDTLYLQKFDVDSSSNGMYWHQYMQNICAPSSEAKSIRKLYEEVGALDNIFVFKIPVYHNMPASCPYPSTSDRIVLEALEGYADPTIYLDGVGYVAEKRNGYYIARPNNMIAKTATMYQYNESGVPVGMAVWTLENDGTYYKATEIPELRDLLTYHGFSIRITGKAGIRYKSGIVESTKEALLSVGLAGYTLKEYGNLVMVNDNRSIYPMIKGGEKVISGMSYGVDASGNVVDTVYEMVNGRQRFTSVLVGLPATQYKVDYAFRGYAVLMKDGQEMTLYGPIMHRSIYQLAQQALGLNMYVEGSEAYNFLKQLIADGDNAQQVVAGSDNVG